jgi:xanthine dehydrogenase accessory factor
MSDLVSLLSQLDRSAGPWMMVTLMETEGSTYRRPGTHLLVNPHGYLGMLSGGCLEEEVRARCAPLFEGTEQMLEMVIDTRRLLGCDGRLTLLAEPLSEVVLAQVEAVRRDRRPGILWTRRAGPDWQPTSLEPGNAGDFAQQLLPPLRLLVFSSSPGARPLRALAEALGWEHQQLVLASDPAARRAVEQINILSGAAGWKALAVDERTACLAMNHHVGRDSEVLKALWSSATPYLGLVGSRRRRDEILDRLAFTGELELEARRLYAPAGLDLGGEGPCQIALEICAQIQQLFATRLLATPELIGQPSPD